MSDSFISSKRFFDNKNFPHGFSRHGDFSIKEATLLEKHGQAFQALSNDTVKPKTKDEKEFVAVIKGNKEPVTEYQKVWVKYLNLITKSKKFHTLSGGRPQIDTTDDYHDNDE